MNKLLLFFCLSIILWSCNGKTENVNADSESKQKISEQTAEKQDQENTEQLIESEKIKNLIITNKADYAQNFIEDLRQQPIGEVTLDGNKFIFDGVEATFPEYPAMNKYTVLTCKKGELAIALKVKRINQTTIDYEIEMVEFGKASKTTEGQATISATSMYLGSESDENERSGISYEAYEYVDTKDDCYTYIRLGKDDESPYLLGRLIKNCNGKIQDIDLDFGMFIEK